MGSPQLSQAFNAWGPLREFLFRLTLRLSPGRTHEIDDAA